MGMKMQRNLKLPIHGTKRKKKMLCINIAKEFETPSAHTEEMEGKQNQWSCIRGRLMEFLILCTHELEISPRIKYSAFAIFAERFYPSLPRLEEDKAMGSWLLHPITESNIQLFALTSIWISSKFHGSPPLSVKLLKSLGDKYITEQHFTTRDFKEAVLEFRIGTSNIALVYLEELLDHLKEVSLAGEYVKLEVCCDIMDLLYEKEATLDLFSSPCSLAASVLVAAYVIAVPKQRWEFPLLPWVKFVTSFEGDDILKSVKYILRNVFEPDAL